MEGTYRGRGGGNEGRWSGHGGDLEGTWMGLRAWLGNVAGGHERGWVV